ncbi:HNH endonuclease [Burkholderia cenocepacia]|uniref:HNH endonuclease n=1 Tax=Burkholderia cenocepacia TaxID=95486 RepID=UPI002B24199E|nr:HNH endonuclease [Burkholderia cenocepacia]MEB2604822.1 HNH endonuclease [Burkholderia cenocepacia]
MTRVFERNPDVIAEALHLARGICQGCGNPAPFERKATGRPYLEVHHVVPLAEGGDDTVSNAIALCPNCHRERHYG